MLLMEMGRLNMNVAESWRNVVVASEGSRTLARSLEEPNLHLYLLRPRLLMAHHDIAECVLRLISSRYFAKVTEEVVERVYVVESREMAGRSSFQPCQPCAVLSILQTLVCSVENTDDLQLQLIE